MTAQVMQPAPDFALQGYDRTSDSFKDYKLEDFKGKWVCLFFYPLDFTFVCPTELVAFNEALGKFRRTELPGADRQHRQQVLPQRLVRR